MKKRIFSYGFLLALFVSLISCVDPNTVAIANGTTTTGITGPRILEKMSINNQDWEYYDSSNGVVPTYTEKNWENNSATQTHKYTVTYSGAKIAKYKMVSTDVGNSNTLTNEYIPTYDSSGRITSYVGEQYLNSMHMIHYIGNYTYDSAGKITKAVENQGNISASGTTTYNVIKTVNFSYSGENISKIQEVTDQLNTSTNPSTVMNTTTYTYEYSQFDSQNSPYSTFSKDLRVCMGMLVSVDYARLSPNNPIKYKVTVPMLPAVETNYVYQYDNQGYPVSISGRKFTYKAL